MDFDADAYSITSLLLRKYTVCGNLRQGFHPGTQY